ncbi:hypothetical protein GGX14DRAFT_640095 [Mycena pura]|uniref:Uncharacterized protein n=1 Tax=Mycena pura TaxID=153505 RepID=A0AAD7E2Z7_9AGAR|nr:hypothetical protein GGX14DRAFT_640095 [Mycena pura]
MLLHNIIVQADVHNHLDLALPPYLDPLHDFDGRLAAQRARARRTRTPQQILRPTRQTPPPRRDHEPLRVRCSHGRASSDASARKRKDMPLRRTRTVGGGAVHIVRVGEVRLEGLHGGRGVHLEATGADPPDADARQGCPRDRVPRERKLFGRGCRYDGRGGVVLAVLVVEEFCRLERAMDRGFTDEQTNGVAETRKTSRI